MGRPSARENHEAVEWLLAKHQPELTVWELDFLESVGDLRGLSPRQQETLDRIWREVVEERRRR
jgi:hypothetical protein